MKPFDCLVIGAGVMGATVALHAARGGLSTALVDRGPICREASGVNAGTLTLHMTRADLIPYAIEGWRLWTNADAWLGGDVGVVPAPGLCLAFTDDEAALLEQRSSARRAQGAPIELVDAAAARAIEPGLSAQVQLAAHCPLDGHVTAYLTGRAYRAALVEAGVTLFENMPVGGLDRAGGQFVAEVDGVAGPRGRRVVLAGGVWLEPMLGWLGVRLPIKVLVNQLAVTERLSPVMRSVLTIANGLLSLKQFDNGTVLVGGGWQGRGGRDLGGTELVPENLIGNLRLACWAVPALAKARLLRGWLGLEAETADAMPVVGPVPGVADAYVIGSVHSGYTSGPYVGRLLAQHLLDQEPERPLFPMDRLVRPLAEETAR
ncbi:MAG: FAD-dependent oxidoreductase [Pseudomonadota bacterium]